MNRTDDEKREYLEKHANCVESVPEDERAEFKALVEEGCDKEWTVALHIKAYGCYGGNALFECDWVASRDYLLKLVELTDDPFYYNTLGYIFYYGRCNNGVPEYDKAFQYFSVGAANGIFESMYKLSDMFIGGKGCLKSPNAGAKLVLSMYRENREIFCNEDFDGKFADVGLRVGGLFENGVGVEADPVEAYAFYLEAKTAIEKRTANFDFYGDKKVERNINEAIARIIPKLPKDYFQQFKCLNEPWTMGELLGHSIGLDITLTKVKGCYRIDAKGFAGDDLKGIELINIPELKYCKLVNETSLYLDPEAEIITEIEELPFKAFITDLSYDTDTGICEFMYRDRVMLAVKSENFFFYER